MFNKLSVNFYKRFINSKRNKKAEHLFLFGIYDKIFYMEVVMDLFDYMREDKMEKESPLASRLRPRTLDEIVGQQHIIGRDKMLYRAINREQARQPLRRSLPIQPALHLPRSMQR